MKVAMQKDRNFVELIQVYFNACKNYSLRNEFQRIIYKR